MTFPVRIFDIERLAVGRGIAGEALSWSPYPWFSDVRALAALEDGGCLVAGRAGLSRLDAEMTRCTWRDDTEALVDLDRGPGGLLAAGDNLCFWPDFGADVRRGAPAELGLSAAPERVRWHPDGTRAAVADALGQIVLVTLHAGEARLERVLGDVPEVTGLAWDPTGRTLAIAGVFGDRAAVWRWTADGGLRRLPLEPSTAEGPSRAAVAFDPHGGRLHVFHGTEFVRIIDERTERIADLMDVFPSSGRWLDASSDAVLIGSASDGVHVVKGGLPTSAQWYTSPVSIRVYMDSPCGARVGDRLWLGTDEGLLVARSLDSAAAQFCFGVPLAEHVRGISTLAPDLSAIAFASGYDRVTLWHLARDSRPVRVRTWEAVDVEHAWHRSSSCLQISGSSSEYVEINDWCDLDVGEGEPGYPEYRARRSPDREFLARKSSTGWFRIRIAGDSIELKSRWGELVRLQGTGLTRVFDVGRMPSGELLIVGASTRPRRS